MYYGDDKFSEKQTARIVEFFQWMDKINKGNEVKIDTGFYYRDRDFNFYTSFNQSETINGEIKHTIKHLQIDQEGKLIDVGDFYQRTPQSVRALYDKFDRFKQLTENELKNYYTMKADSNLERFTTWTPWAERENLIEKEILKNPGVYCIAVSYSSLKGKQIDWKNDPIEYIGMTNSKNGLAGRLKQFDNSIKDLDGHGGGERFRNKYDNYNEVVPTLYVALKGFCLSEGKTSKEKVENLLTKGKVLEFEYICFAKYAEFHKGELPLYNRPTSEKRKVKTAAK